MDEWHTEGERRAVNLLRSDTINYFLFKISGMHIDLLLFVIYFIEKPLGDVE